MSRFTPPNAVLIVGTRQLHPSQTPIIERALTALPDRSWLLVGGGYGVDTTVARLGKKLGHRIYLVIPAARYNQAIRTYADRIERTREGGDFRSSYIIRDLRMIELATRVIAFPWTSVPESGSTTWRTIALAQRAGKLASGDIHPLKVSSDLVPAVL